MADPPRSDVFKFVALRPPVSVRPDASHAIASDQRAPDQTPVGELLGKGAADTVVERVTKLVRARRFDPTFPESEGDTSLRKIHARVSDLPPDDVTTATVRDAIEDVLGQPLDQDLLGRLGKQRDAIWDRYQAFLVLSRVRPQDMETLTLGLRIHHLIDHVAAGAATDAETVRTLLSAVPVVDRSFRIPPRTPQEPAGAAHGANDARVAEYKELWSQLVDTRRALAEVRALRPNMETVETSEEIEVPNRLTGRADLVTETRRSLRSAITDDDFKATHPKTRALLADLRMTRQDLSIPRATAGLTQRLSDVTTRIAAIDDMQFLDYAPAEAQVFEDVKFANERVSANVHIGALYKDDLFPSSPPGSVRGQIRPLGIGDLKVVKQRLRRYMTGEVAHIENVLRGEYRERKHRVLDRTEETITVETETEEETTKDTQTTERFELKKESERTIQEQMSIQAGVTVSGSYGAVTFGAHGDFAYSTSSQETVKNASNFAREVVDKAVSRIQKRTREERVRKTLHEVEELNTHGVDNKGQPDHVTGIYRWVDKQYEAQVYNYGKRMMLEFIVPEPSAFFDFALRNQPEPEIAPPKPLPPSLTHRGINATTYRTYIRDYNVQGCTPPPDDFRVMTASISSDAKMENGTSFARTSKDLVIPEGYHAFAVDYSLSFIYENYPQFRLSMGEDWEVYSHINNTARRRQDATTPNVVPDYDGIVPFSVNMYDVHSYFVNVSVTCELTPRKYEQWQLETFDKITTAYRALQAEYEQKVAAQETQEGIRIEGRNPRLNRAIERNELKRASIKLLLDTSTYGSFNAMKQSGNAPDFDIFDAMSEAPTIQFLEQAFEWENLTYLFYPYFWGRRNQWISKVGISDPDPLFAAFRQAGSARVLVPVHPGYNDAVMYFLENDGAVWSGGTAPLLNDPLFISIADELRDQTDDLGNATPESTPWDVTLPTTLVYLQEDATLPTFP